MQGPIEFAMEHSARNETSETLRAYAERRLSFALRRFQDRVRHVKVRLVDLNGPRRGVDSRCSITVDLVDGRRLFVQATTAWPFASIQRAAARLNKSVRRQSGRSTNHRTRAALMAAGRRFAGEPG
jgi:ribosome-associated translation inhibitor RaiA